MGRKGLSLGSASVPIALSGWDYVMRRPFRTLFVVALFGLFRFLSGRDIIRGGRRTDATFLRPARKVRGSVWHRLPGVARLVVRLVLLVVLIACLRGDQVLAILVGVALLAGWVWAGVRQLREDRHHARHVAPVWPAVASILQVDQDEDPTRWLDIPGPLETPESTPVTVGLPAGFHDDDRRVDMLANLFTQRLGHTVSSRINYQARVVEFRRRPDEPDIWPAIADVLDVRASELADEWVTISPYIEDGSDSADAELPATDRKALAEQRKQDATVVVSLPVTVVDHEPIVDNLITLVNQRYGGGKWSARTDRVKRQVRLYREKPTPVPPTNVDFLAEHPDYQEGN